ncbi:MAG: hypothetical protein JWO88_3184 [Frankiales bacterium]|nr:hypothetical protein [Frankiales bacterium]
MTSMTAERRRVTLRHQPERHVATRSIGALLALAVAYIHIKDQGGFPGDKAPTYVGVGYYLLEAAGLVAALALLAGAGKHTLKAWALVIGVALGPLVGFVLSRGPGLPGYTDDKGNWTEPLGVISLIVEGLLLVVAAVVLTRSTRTAP